MTEEKRCQACGEPLWQDDGDGFWRCENYQCEEEMYVVEMEES